MFSKGDKVRAVKDCYGYLTKGRIYTVLEEKPTEMVEVIADDGTSGWFFPIRFEAAKLTNKERVKQRMEELNV